MGRKTCTHIDTYTHRERESFEGRFQPRGTSEVFLTYVSLITSHWTTQRSLASCHSTVSESLPHQPLRNSLAPLSSAHLLQEAKGSTGLSPELTGRRVPGREKTLELVVSLPPNTSHRGQQSAILGEKLFSLLQITQAPTLWFLMLYCNSTKRRKGKGDQVKIQIR